MRVLIDSSTYHCRNAGDVAMMLAAVERIRDYCPAAEIRMVTLAPESLAILFPRVVPVPCSFRQAWLESGCFLGRCRERLPGVVLPLVKSIERRVWGHLPKVSACGMRVKQRLLGRERVDPSRFLAEIRSSDLVVGCGMGALNDVFGSHALSLLEVYAAAIRHHVPVVLFGQGIGPISNRELFQRAGEVLPLVQFIGLREGRHALPLLASLGVPAESVEVTGDDATELAFRRRKQHPGSGIGVNVRVASYAATDGAFAERVQVAMKNAAEKYGAPVVPMFALAQGIPAVCIEKSAYYSQKFCGLREQFGEGCTVVQAAESDFGFRLEQAIEHAWRSAGDLRPRLLQAAASQIEKGRAAYARVFETFREPKRRAAAAH